MTAIQRFALHGTIMNPHSRGPYVRHEDHLAAMQGRCLAQIEEPAGAAPAAVAPSIKGLLDEDGENQAVRMLLMVYGQAHMTVPAAWSHMKSAGWPQAPEWVASEKGPLTKGGAQSWLRHLFALEGAAPALEAPAAPAVPAGFALVPIEPTQQMLDAGRWSGAGSVIIQEEWARKEVWSRMLTTVTPPPAAYADDLVALVTELVQALRKATPDNDLAGHALDYLKRNGLQESPLRAADTAPQAPAAPAEGPPEAPDDAEAAEHWISACDSAGIQFDGIAYGRGFCDGRTVGADAAAPAAPVVDDDGHLSDELRELITGMTVSVDVSTGEHDAGNRLFGEVSEVMDYDQGGDKHGVVLLVQSPEPNFKAAPAAPAVDALAPVQALLDVHAALLDANPYAYFELAYTRQTGWMAWITDKPFHGPVINPERKVLARGQGDTAAAACAAAAQAAAKGEHAS